ncbi:MAG: histidine kinase [Deltaproteobacteria bacterium]|nr:histidine kinase [Deltaproteobacteria bacterium]
MLRSLAIAVALLATWPARAAAPITFVPHRPSGAVFTSAQTPDGYMWFGTLNGLYRFDGVRYDRFAPENTPAFSHARIYHLAVTTDGRLWVASGNPGAQKGPWERGGPGLWVKDKAGFIAMHQALPSPWVMSLAADDHNRLWVGTQEGLVVVEGNKVTQLGFPEHTDHNVFHVRPDGEGRVWIGAQPGLFRFEDGRFTQTDAGLYPISSSTAPDGTLWMTNLHAVYRLLPGHDQWELWLKGVDVGLSQIRAVAQDLRGHVWVAGSGLARVDPVTKKTSPFQAMDVTSDPNRFMIHSLLFDREGSLWAGSREGGVFQGTPARVANYGSREGMPGDVGFSCLAGDDAHVYLAYGGGVTRVIDDTFEPLTDLPNAPRAPVRSMAQAPDHSVWMVGEEGFVHRLAHKAFAKLSLASSDAKTGPASSLIFDEHGDLWIAFDGGVVGRYVVPEASAPTEPLTPVQSFTSKDGLCQGRHLVAARRRAGGVWFGSYDEGISQVSAEGATCIKGGGIPIGTIMGLHEEPDGSLYFGVNGIPGLFRRRPSKLSHYAQGISATAFGITSDLRGHLWMGSSAGALKVTVADLDANDASPDPAHAPLPWLAFSHADGLRGDESMGGTSPAAALGHDGRFWFPTLRGFSAIADPETLTPVPLVPPTVQNVRANDDELLGAGPHVLPAGTKSFAISYTSATFTLPSQLSFEYQLQGFDSSWVQAQNRRAAFYTNVPPGRYQFMLRVRRGGGRPVSMLQPMVIRVSPFFYQTWAFYLVVAALVLAAAFAAHKLRLAQLESRHFAIHVERARLARELHDHLGQGFTAIGFALDALRARLKGNDSAHVAEQARGILEHCQIETRRLVWDLRSEAERHPDLQAALRQMVERSRVEGGPQIEFVCEGQSQVSGMAQHELPLIAQEAVTNALRHAQAERITVSLQCSDATTTITVTDDGKGFPAKPGGGSPALDGHFGLVGMEERARRLQADLQIHSGPGVGTEISITVSNNHVKP